MEFLASAKKTLKHILVATTWLRKALVVLFVCNERQRTYDINASQDGPMTAPGQVLPAAPPRHHARTPLRSCQTGPLLTSLAEAHPIPTGVNANGTVDYVRYVGHRVDDQMSIFSAISIASSTSMPT